MPSGYLGRGEHFSTVGEVSPVDVVESYVEEEVDKSPDKGSLSSTADAGAARADTSRSYSADAEDSDNIAGDNPMNSGQPSEQSTDQDQSQQPGKRWAIPGANSRGKKAKDWTGQYSSQCNG
ncbi:hypothetical protein KUCAC02_001863 [Chaenocephalus aceratus]|uniref:Uncharacterized protein n=1 Tax=Chaenocephalus aceratus TaxID=36190 RepID=A0ACB9XSK9_CHAAC|nr:hypothetical protein KUCAC02_001863 [Chaenocephalus aceratus]